MKNRTEALGKLVAMAALFAAVSLAADPVPNGTYLATAYAQSGTTASGIQTKRHVIAADPDILPIGSRIKVRHAGRYSGEYVVADTGRKIQGRRLDIYMPSEKACIRFGKKNVRVRVLQVGDGTHQTTAQAEQVVKQDVQKDLAKKAVGNAATEDDWAAKKGAEQAATQTKPAATATAPASELVPNNPPQQKQ